MTVTSDVLNSSSDEAQEASWVYQRQKTIAPGEPATGSRLPPGSTNENRPGHKTGPVEDHQTPVLADIFGQWSSKHVMVEVVGRYSNFPQPLLSGQADRLNQAATASALPKSSEPRVHAVHRRLSPDTIQQLITDYQAGTPSTQLMLTYNLGKGTVLRLLREHDVQLRRQRMSPDEITQAAQLYGQGLSLTAVGQQLGYDHSVIWRALRQADVPRRDSHGRER